MTVSSHPPTPQDGARDLTQVMKKWKPWLPPKANQGLQQGGCVVFKGRDAALEHLDEVRVLYAYPHPTRLGLLTARAMSCCEGWRSPTQAKETDDCRPLGSHRVLPGVRLASHRR